MNRDLKLSGNGQSRLLLTLDFTYPVKRIFIETENNINSKQQFNCTPEKIKQINE